MKVRTLMATILVAGSARAGNQDSFFLGNQAALSAGAVLAYGEDAGSLWYNPAGLTLVDRSAIDVSASAFVLRVRDFPDGIRTRLPTKEISRGLSSVELLSVPTSLVFVRGLTDELTLGVGVFVPAQDTFATEDTVLVTNVFPEGIQPIDFQQRIALTWDVARYDLVVGVGWEALKTLRLGLATSIIYETGNATAQLWARLSSQEGAENYIDGTEFYEAYAEESRLSLQVILGMQWEIAPRWHLGVVVRSPQFQLHRWGHFNTLQAQSAVGVGTPVSGSIFLEEDIPGGGALAGPTRVHLGITRTFDWGWLALEGDYAHAFENEDLGIELEHVGNARFGARFHITETIIGGAGLFTDLSPAPTPQDLGEDRIHFFGVAGGLEWRTRYPLAGEDDHDLEFATTFALRYAIGLGETGGLLVNLSGEEVPNPITFTQNDSTFHELSLHIGSSVYF